MCQFLTGMLTNQVENGSVLNGPISSMMAGFRRAGLTTAGVDEFEEPRNSCNFRK